MVIIGLTGSIGMGKSTVARQFAAFGAKVCSADACVHKLMAKGGVAVGEIAKYFTDAVKNHEIDRQVLGKIVFADKKKLTLLENILHPMVQEMEDDFTYRAKNLGAKIVVLDIPLLFETGGEQRVDFTVAVTAPAFIQRQRVMVRKGMTAEKFERIVASQLPSQEKEKRADFVIQTGLGKAHSFMAVKELVSSL